MSTTEEGKAISRYNAVKHGLLSKEVRIDSEDEKSLTELNTALFETLAPMGALEELLVDRIVSSVWRLRRAIAVERNAMEFLKADSFPPFDGDGEKKSQKDMLDNEGIENILRYETTIERGIYRALHELERLQARRNGKDVPIPAVLDVNLNTPHEFVSQK